MNIYYCDNCKTLSLKCIERNRYEGEEIVEFDPNGFLNTAPENDTEYTLIDTINNYCYSCGENSIYEIDIYFSNYKKIYEALYKCEDYTVKTNGNIDYTVPLSYTDFLKAVI
jgi:hypothetical protein